DPASEVKHLRTRLGNRQRLRRQIDRGHLSAGAREIDGIGADTTTDLQDLLAAPASEFGEGGDMRLDVGLSPLAFVATVPRSDRLGRMADVAGARIPIGAYTLHRHAIKNAV